MKLALESEKNEAGERGTGSFPNSGNQQKPLRRKERLFLFHEPLAEAKTRAIPLAL